MADRQDKQREFLALLKELIKATSAMRREVEQVDRLLAAAHRKP